MRKRFKHAIGRNVLAPALIGSLPGSAITCHPPMSTAQNVDVNMSVKSPSTPLCSESAGGSFCSVTHAAICFSTPVF